MAFQLCRDWKVKGISNEKVSSHHKGMQNDNVGRSELFH